MHSFSTASRKLVFLRHGESIWNKEKRWAGWTDVPLSSNGIKQAKECARLMKNHQDEFDEAYTSLLSRAIKTLNYVLDEMDSHFIPVHKDWRLNEKQYGSLQVPLSSLRAKTRSRLTKSMARNWLLLGDAPTISHLHLWTPTTAGTPSMTKGINT